MPWSAELVERLGDPEFRPLFRFESIELNSGAGVLSAGGFSFGHERISIEASTIADAPSRLQVAGATLSVSRGSWQVALRFDPAELASLGSAAIVKGGACALLLGWDDLALDAYEPVQLGVVRNMRREGALYVVDCGDVLEFLHSRTYESADVVDLFYQVTATTTIAVAGYVAGAANLDVVSTANFQRATGGSYGLKVTRNNGSTFILTAAGASAAQFTGLSALAIPGSGTAGAANIGNLVEEVAFSSAHPSVIARRVLVGTGAGTNGTHDIFPGSWGFGVVEQYIDEEDADAWAAEFTASSSPEWYMLVEESQPDGLAWLDAWLNPGGWFVCQRQGALTLGEWDSPGGFEITYADIVSVDRYERWDPAFAFEANELVLTTGGATEESLVDEPSGAIDTRPAVSSTGIGPVDGIRQNAVAVAGEVLQRLTPHACRAPELLELTLRGFRWATIALGELGVVTAPVVGRSCTEQQPTLLEQRCIALAVLPDWFSTQGPVTRITLLITPEDATELS